MIIIIIIESRKHRIQGKVIWTKKEEDRQIVIPSSVIIEGSGVGGLVTYDMSGETLVDAEGGRNSKLSDSHLPSSSPRLKTLQQTTKRTTIPRKTREKKEMDQTENKKQRMNEDGDTSKQEMDKLEAELAATRQLLQKEKEEKAALQQQNAEKDKLLQKEKEEKEEKDKLLQKEKEEKEAARQREADALQLLEGTYCEVRARLWKFDTSAIPQQEAFSVIMRSKVHILYQEIVNTLRGQSRRVDPKFDATVSTSTAGRKKNGTEGVTIFGNKGREKAHLIPNAASCAAAYGIVAQAVVGLDLERAGGFWQRDNLVSGLLQLALGQQQEEGQKDHIRGLRGHSHNLLSLPRGHEAIFDNNPHVIIVPILTLEKVKEWKSGTPYEVMVVAEDASIYKQLALNSKPSTCSLEEVEAATELLKQYVLALAAVLCRREGSNEQRSLTPMDLMRRDPNRLDEKIAQLYDVRRQLMKHGNVKTPVVQEEIRRRFTAVPSNVRVLKVWSSVGGEPIPDPALVAIKAAVNWSAANEQKLLPGCPPAIEDEEESWYPPPIVYGTDQGSINFEGWDALPDVVNLCETLVEADPSQTETMSDLSDDDEPEAVISVSTYTSRSRVSLTKNPSRRRDWFSFPS